MCNNYANWSPSTLRKNIVYTEHAIKDHQAQIDSGAPDAQQIEINLASLRKNLAGYQERLEEMAGE
ncbi:MAG: hypothetical protein P4N59_03590 [Negativicutes bacterium]|nr:hypothetical protein [Negativicutes bacterium]